MKQLTLEERVTRLEKLINEEDDIGVKTAKDYLHELAVAIFNNRKLNPKGLRPDGSHAVIDEYSRVLIPSSSIGTWRKLIDDSTSENPLMVPDETMNRELKRVVGTFCKKNKCLVDMVTYDGKGNNGSVWFYLTKMPGEAKPYRIKRWNGGRGYSSTNNRSRANSYNGYAHPDDQWEDPDFQDMRNAERWAQAKRDNPGLYS